MTFWKSCVSVIRCCVWGLRLYSSIMPTNYTTWFCSSTSLRRTELLWQTSRLVRGEQVREDLSAGSSHCTHSSLKCSQLWKYHCWQPWAAWVFLKSQTVIYISTHLHLQRVCQLYLPCCSGLTDGFCMKVLLKLTYWLLKLQRANIWWYLMTTISH